jgi:presenilin-like A22 family membrane protease
MLLKVFISIIILFIFCSWWFVSSLTPVYKETDNVLKTDDVQLDHPVTEHSLSETNILSGIYYRYFINIFILFVILILKKKKQKICSVCYNQCQI